MNQSGLLLLGLIVFLLFGLGASWVLNDMKRLEEEQEQQKRDARNARRRELYREKKERERLETPTLIPISQQTPLNDRIACIQRNPHIDDELKRKQIAWLRKR